MNFLGQPLYAISNVGGGGGDVTGPISSTPDSIARFDGLTGKLIKSGNAAISNSGTMTGVNVINDCEVVKNTTGFLTLEADNVVLTGTGLTGQCECNSE